MDLQLTGRRAVITGGSRGIGLAIARALAAEGADVALVARDVTQLDIAAAELAAGGALGRVTTAACDTGDDVSVRAMAAHVRSELGGVEILVNSAAQANTGPMSDDMLDEQLNVKLKGYLRCARARSRPGWSPAGGAGSSTSRASRRARPGRSSARSATSRSQR